MYFYQFSILKYPVLLLLSPLFIHQHLWPETEKANCHRIHQSQHGFHGNKNPNLFQGSDTFRFGGASRFISEPQKSLGSIAIPNIYQTQNK